MGQRGSRNPSPPQNRGGLPRGNKSQRSDGPRVTVGGDGRMGQEQRDPKGGNRRGDLVGGGLPPPRVKLGYT